MSPFGPYSETLPDAQPVKETAIFRGASWLCEGCGWSDTEPGPHCGRDLAPVWVTLTRREVG